jgi:hypothetical protein
MRRLPAPALLGIIPASDPFRPLEATPTTPASTPTSTPVSDRAGWQGRRQGTRHVRNQIAQGPPTTVRRANWTPAAPSLAGAQKDGGGHSRNEGPCRGWRTTSRCGRPSQVALRRLSFPQAGRRHRYPVGWNMHDGTASASGHGGVRGQMPKWRQRATHKPGVGSSASSRCD